MNYNNERKIGALFDSIYSMKIWFLIFFLFSSFCYSQDLLQCSVKDFGTKEPLAYCSVAVKRSGSGCITNTEGVFGILIDSTKDTLVFSYVGYKRKIIPV